INDEGQASSALSRVEGLTSAPWYSGSLEGLRALVKRKVHSKYPGIGKDKKSKKSYIEVSDTLFKKYAQGQPAAAPAVPGPDAAAKASAIAAAKAAADAAKAAADAATKAAADAAAKLKAL